MTAQRAVVQRATEQFTQAERVLFEADRELSRFAESLENTLQAKNLMSELDKEKCSAIYPFYFYRLILINFILLCIY
jgi:hypothetical protein